ncbi:MAG: VirB4 family type IV secretion system protein [Candidatus Dormibacteraceae bacterium]
MVLEVGPMGFIGASEDDCGRWLSGFRTLLDGLNGPLQVVIQRQPGSGSSGPAGSARAAPSMRDQDLAFVSSLDRRPDTMHHRLWFVVGSADAERTADALGRMGATVESILPAGLNPVLAQGFETARHYGDQSGFHRTWSLTRFPGAALEAGWLGALTPPAGRVALSWHALRLPSDWLLTHLQRQLVTLQSAALQRGVAFGAAARSEAALPAVEDLRRRVTANEESGFHVSVYITASADTPADLQVLGERIEAAARGMLCGFAECRLRQRDGRLSTLPLGTDALRRTHLIDTSALVTLFPWRYGDLRQGSGMIVGRSEATGRPVVLDPFEQRQFSNANIGVFGHSGAGKTHLLSSIALGALGLGAQVMIMDPEHEYGQLARHLGGSDVRLAIGAGTSINVLQSLQDSGEGPAGVVSDALELCAAITGGLTEVERVDLEQALAEALAASGSPVLSDVVARLAPKSRVESILRRWTAGPLGAVFSRPTNVDLEAPIVVFGMRDVRPELLPPVHFLIAQALWARIRRRDRRRLLLIDEVGLLFEDAAMRAFVVSLARRIRKYDGALVFATQNPTDLLSTDAGLVVASNPAINFFGAMRPGEASRLQAAFDLSDSQRRHLERAERGQFLACAGAQRLPVRVEAPPWQTKLMALARGMSQVGAGP